MVKDIFSADEDAAIELEDAALDEDTIQELDEEVRDPNRVFSKMGKVKKAIARRTKRLDKARHEAELQKVVVEEAQSVLATRVQAVESIERDIHRLMQVQEDLSRRHAELAAEAAKQQGGNERPPSLEEAAQQAQQLLWNIASSLRELGDDPRLSQAIALLGSLFQDASAAAAPPVAVEAPPTFQAAATCSAAANSVPVSAADALSPNPLPTGRTPLPAVVQPPSPPPQSVQAHSSPTQPHVAAVQLSATSDPMSPGGGTPGAAAICPKCWSVSCRCLPSGGADAAGVAPCMEVDQERGKKRPCGEAEFPQRINEGQSGAGAIIVDSSGNPAALAAEEEEPIAIAVEGRPSEGAKGQEGKEPKPLSMHVELEPHTGPGAVEDPAPPRRHSKDPKADDAEKESSRKAFSALVGATCPQRAYPYSLTAGANEVPRKPEQKV